MCSVRYTVSGMMPMMRYVALRLGGGEAPGLTPSVEEKEHHQGSVCPDRNIQRLLLTRPFFYACFQKTEPFASYGNEKDL